MRWPLDSFVISQGFHGINKDYAYEHWGTDLAADEGVDIKAPESGVITAVNSGWTGKAPFNYLGGNYVKMTGDSGHSYYMGHMSVTRATPGRRVNEGEVIGKVGKTGQATGPHVHLEMYKNGSAVDATKVIKGGSMEVQKVDIDVARCLAYWVGRDGREGRPNARNGQTDADLIKYHVGQELTPKFIFGWMNGGEMTETIKRIDALYRERDMLKKRVAALEAELKTSKSQAEPGDAEKKLQKVRDAFATINDALSIK